MIMENASISDLVETISISESHEVLLNDSSSEVHPENQTQTKAGEPGGGLSESIVDQKESLGDHTATKENFQWNTRLDIPISGKNEFQHWEGKASKDEQLALALSTTNPHSLVNSDKESVQQQPEEVTDTMITTMANLKNKRDSFLDAHQHVLDAMRHYSRAHAAQSPFWSKMKNHIVAEQSGVKEYKENTMKMERVLGAGTTTAEGVHPPLCSSSNKSKEQAASGPWAKHDFLSSLQCKASAAWRHNQESQRWFIPSKGPLKALYDLFFGLLILFSVVTIPVQMAFKGAMDENVLMVPFLVVDCLFLFDIVVTFFTPYEQAGRLVYNRRKIARRYVKGLFVVDFMSSFPFDRVLSRGSNLVTLGAARVLKLSKLLRVLKFLRLFRLRGKLKPFDFAGTFNVEPATIKLLGRMSKIFFLVHIFACVWHAVNSCSSEDEDWLRCGSSNNLVSQYLASLYFAIQTMMTVGYGDIRVNGTAQRSFAMLIQISGPLVFGFIVSSISELVDSFDVHSKVLAERMSALKEYMTEKKLPADLGRKINNHFIYFYTRTTIFQEQTIMRSLPFALHQRVILKKHQQLVDTLNFFRLCKEFGHKDFMLTVMPLLKPMLSEAGEDIALQSDPAEEVYFVLKGQVNQILFTRGGGVVLIGVRRQGSTINLAHVIFYRTLHCTLRTACLSDLLWITMEDLEMVVDMFPSAALFVQEMAKKELHLNAEVLESSTTNHHNHFVKAMVLVESAQKRLQVQPYYDVEVEPIKGALTGTKIRTVRTLTFTGTLSLSVAIRQFTFFPTPEN